MAELTISPEEIRSALDTFVSNFNPETATRDEVVRRDRDDATVSQFTVAADGVITIDTSALDFEQSVAAVIAVVDSSRSG